MKKVGIIDSYISNYHASTYFKLFHEIAEEENREEYVITDIYAVNDVSPSTNETTDQWCERTGAVKRDNIKDVVDNVDVIMVLAPNNPELHEELCELPLKSGKPVYVDKTFAPDFETAKRIAEAGKNAKFWSTSATRFEDSISEFLYNENSVVNGLSVSSGYQFEIYCIHLIEITNTFMKNGAEEVICYSGAPAYKFEILYNDGRKAYINEFEGNSAPFTCFPEIDGKCKYIPFKGDFWKSFAKAVLDFFDTGVAPVKIESTIECIAIRDALIEAKNNIGKAVKVKK